MSPALLFFLHFFAIIPIFSFIIFVYSVRALLYFFRHTLQIGWHARTVNPLGTTRGKAVNQKTTKRQVSSRYQVWFEIHFTLFFFCFPKKIALPWNQIKTVCLRVVKLLRCFAGLELPALSLKQFKWDLAAAQRKQKYSAESTQFLLLFCHTYIKISPFETELESTQPTKLACSCMIK